MANEENKMSKEEQIGFHKGSVSTLVKEREELVKMVNVVTQLLNIHLKSLKELGVDLVAENTENKPQEDKKLEEV